MLPLEKLPHSPKITQCRSLCCSIRQLFPKFCINLVSEGANASLCVWQWNCLFTKGCSSPDVLPHFDSASQFQSHHLTSPATWTPRLIVSLTSRLFKIPCSVASSSTFLRIYLKYGKTEASLQPEFSCCNTVQTKCLIKSFQVCFQPLCRTAA